MRNRLISYFNNERGLTLAEVLASIVILMLVLTLFSQIFVQSIKTTKTSEEIIDSTYIAQKEMENMYELSRMVPTDERAKELKDEYNYGNENFIDEWQTFERPLEEDENMNITLQFKKDDETGLTRVLVQVFEADAERPKVQMENYIDWKADRDEAANE